jgi:hypothetical protein
LHIGEWSFRQLVYAGLVKRVRVPAPGQGEVRRLLVDRADLDALIEQWKDGPAA